MFVLVSAVQKRVDAIGMYRTVTLTLFALVVISLLLGLAGILSYTFSEQFLSLATALAVGLLANGMFAKLLRIPTNHESAIITALILFFLFIPASTLMGYGIIALATVIAIASKFLVAWKRQHIFNPAAVGAFVGGLVGTGEAVWWVGTPWLFVPLVVVGLLVTMKVRKWHLVLWCIAIAFVVYLFETWRVGDDVVSAIIPFFVSWPTIFLAFFMLTEPFTMPPTKKLQACYGAFVGGLSSVIFLAPYVIISPELALLVGNALFFGFTLRKKIYATLIGKKTVAKDTVEFEFTRPKGISFEAGQYLEWMLPHARTDNRGERRYFTVASAPHEDVLRFSVRFAENSSTFKRTLRDLDAGDQIIASQRAGDFVLPSDASKKLAFVAGGIGVTPFISHLRDMRHRKEKRDVTLFYCNNTHEEIAYQEFFDSLASEGYCNPVYVLSREEREGYEHGFLTEEVIKKHATDYLERTWYLSGPPGMVYAYTQLLTGMGVPKRRIIRDFFAGLA